MEKKVASMYQTYVEEHKVNGRIVNQDSFKKKEEIMVMQNSLRY